MRKDIFYDKIPSQYYKKKLSSGCSATCYLTEDGKVYKEFPEYYEYLKELEYLSYFESDFIAFPKEFIFIDNVEQLKGYLMKYIDGISISKLDEATKLRDIINALNEFEREMLRLTQQGLMFNDLNQGNLIFTPDKKIKAVDTDLYDVTYADDVRYMYKQNLLELAATIISQFVGSRDFKNPAMYEEIMKCGAYARIKSSNLIETLAEMAEKETNESIDTLGDFKRTLSILKK